MTCTASAATEQHAGASLHGRLDHMSRGCHRPPRPQCETAVQPFTEPPTIGLIHAGVAASIYVARSTDAIPPFVPGHEAGITPHPTKHGLAMLGLAAVCWAAAWTASGTGQPGSIR